MTNIGWPSGLQFALEVGSFAVLAAMLAALGELPIAAQAKLVICDHTIDFTFIRLGDRFIYLAIILDAFTRAVRGWALSRRLTADTLTVPALQMALQSGVPTIFHSDQGSQYAADDHLEPLLALEVIISMTDKGQPAQNGVVERFIRTLKEEHVDYTEYTDFADAVRQLRYWLEVEYMTERIHSALGSTTLTEFEAVARARFSSSLIPG